jgi:hypothetical protein
MKISLLAVASLVFSAEAFSTINPAKTGASIADK